VPNRIARASAMLASGTIVSRILGFLSAVVLARTVGVIGSGADAFALANQLPNNVYVIVAGGVLSAVLVPQIVKAGLHADGGTSYVNRLVTLGIVLVVGITIIATGLAPLLVRLYAQRGFTESTIALATAFAWWCLPQILFYAIYSLVGEVLNARGVFGPFTWAPALNNIVAIAGMLWFGAVFTGDVANASKWSPMSIAILAGTATLGVAVQALVLFAFLGRAGIAFRLDFHFRGVGLGETTRLAAWTFGMILVTQLAGIVQSNVASTATSFNEPGLAVLRFGWLVFMLPHSVITVSLGTAYFTRMATDVRDKRWDRLKGDVRESLVRVTLFMVLSSAVLWVTANYVSIVFADRAVESGLGNVVALYSIGLVPFGIAFILQRLFYALEDTRTPFLVQLAQTGIFCVGLAVVATGPTHEIANGIALWMSISSFVQAVLLAMLLRRRLGSLGSRALGLSIARFAIAIAPVLAIGLLVRTALPSADSIQAAIVCAAVVAGVMGVAYVGLLILLRDSTTRDFLAPLRGARNIRP